MEDAENNTFASKLADALPLGTQLFAHHLSSPPTQCPAIYSAPPGQKPDKTYCERHFLSISISLEKLQLHVFAIEVLIYSTEYLTTVFVSKADSTGHLRQSPDTLGVVSPLNSISSKFLEHLVAGRRRKGIKLVVSLFARAQDQYLFPGSVENALKHVLDDRRLIKWWCKVLDPIVRRRRAQQDSGYRDEHGDGKNGYRSACYLIVPGCDKYETRSFLPLEAKHESGEEGLWKLRDPLSVLSQTSSLPPRCIIPHFPDDPKARFLDELDDELPESQSCDLGSMREDRAGGHWKSIKTLDQFWEMMAFRQECSSGRLVGFIWGVFPPVGISDRKRPVDDYFGISQSSVPLRDGNGEQHLPTPVQLRNQGNMRPSSFSSLNPSRVEQLSHSSLLFSPALAIENLFHAQQSPMLRPREMKKQKRSGPVITRPPRVKGCEGSTTFMQPENTRYYRWPSSSRGEIVLSETAYKRVNELLLRLDYSNENATANSTRKWIVEVAVVAGVKAWGQLVVGRMGVVSTATSSNTRTGTSLSIMSTSNDNVAEAGQNSREITGKGFHGLKAPNLLGGGLVRKQAKINESFPIVTSPSNGVNNLNADLIRKKAKN